MDLPTPTVVRELRETLRAADAVLIATPEYNASVPGQLKNVLDWASRPFPDNALRDKPVAVVGASTSPFGAVWAQPELRKVLKTIGARVLDAELPVPRAHEVLADDGRLSDEKLFDSVAQAVAAYESPAGPGSSCTRAAASSGWRIIPGPSCSPWTRHSSSESSPTAWSAKTMAAPRRSGTQLTGERRMRGDRAHPGPEETPLAPIHRREI